MKHPTKIPIRSIFISGSAITSIIIFIFLVATNHNKKKYFDKNRNYTLIPFNQYDATQICRSETKYRFGDQLLRTTIDYHSTRMDKITGDYKIYMFADIGTLKHYDEITIHCFVDPKRFMVNYYRLFTEEKGNILDNAIDFFSISG